MKLQQGLAYMKASGGTALYDAVIASADYLTKNAKQSKQVLLIITDGEDNASNATLEQAIERVQDLDGPVDLLHWAAVRGRSGSQGFEARAGVLSELSEETGGQRFSGVAEGCGAGLRQQVAQDIRTQYTIAYRSTKSDAGPGYRQIHVEASRKRGSTGCGCGRGQDTSRRSQGPGTHGRAIAGPSAIPFAHFSGQVCDSFLVGCTAVGPGL